MIRNIDLENADVHYTEYGEGIPVLAIHGYAVNHLLMSSCLEPIFNKQTGYRRIYLDLPGMGSSRVKENRITNADDMLETLISFIKRVIGEQPFLLIGESYGGYLALGLLKQLPSQVRGLMLLCPCMEPDVSKRQLPKVQRFIEDEAFLRQVGLDEQLLKSYQEAAVVVSSQTFDDFSKYIFPALLQGDSKFLEKYQKEGYEFQHFEMSSFEAPSCLIAGRQDQIVGYQDLYDQLHYFPNGSFHVIDRAGHNLQIEQPTIFEACVVDWLEKATKGGVRPL